MSTQTSLKRYVFLRVSILALCMSLLLAYQGTQSFLRGVEIPVKRQMQEVISYMDAGEHKGKNVFEYHIAPSWETVPANIRAVFPSPPEETGKLQIYRKNWWYFAPPSDSYNLIKLFSESGEVRFVSSHRNHASSELAQPGIIPRIKDPMVQMAMAATGVMLFFMLLLYLVFRSLTRPAQQFYQWASGLDLNTVKQPTADFQYQELNTLSSIMHKSMENMGKALEREEEFLAYASHELRTPIAALRSNATLLDKISPSPSSKEREVRDRILRSSLSMKGISETLLWLSRDNQESLQAVHVDVPSLLNQTVEDLCYLLEGKNITLSVETSSCTRTLPEGAFLILVTNIIRNAFQHTAQGKIEILQTDSMIKVSNSVHRAMGLESSGFGLGLKLVRKISDQFGWHLEFSKTKSLHTVCLKIPDLS